MSLKSGNPEYVSNMEHEEEQRAVLRGRLEGKMNNLNRQHEVLVYRGKFAQADDLDGESA